MKKVIIFFISVVFFMLISNVAFSQENFPANPYKLKEIQTEHFIIIYPEGWKSVADKASVFSENAYVEVTDEVGYAPPNKIYIILEPYKEIANGSAATPLNIIRIYLNAPEFTSTIDTYFGDWIETLIIHELVHIVHLGSGNMLVSIPNFLIEGYATYLESILTSGGRVGSSIGDMIMRTQIMYDDFPTIDEACLRGGEITSWPYGSVSYVIGGYFFKYLYEVYGREAVRRFNQMNRSNFVIPFVEINSAKCFGGKNLSQLWGNFKKWSYDKFSPQIDVIKEEETISNYVGNIGFSQSSIAISVEKDLVYFRQYSPDFLPNLYSYNPETSETKLVKKNFLSSDFSVSKDGHWLVYAQKKPDIFNIHYISDIYLENLSYNNLQRITLEGWANNPNISPDNNIIVFSRNNLGGSSIVTKDIKTGYEEILVDGGDKIEYRHPVFSNDGQYIAFIKADKYSHRAIVIYDIQEKSINKTITLEGIIIGKIAWSKDDKHLILTTDRSGVLNIYLFNIEKERFSRVSNLLTGAYNPVQKGDYIYYSRYTNVGYELHRISYTNALQIEESEKQWNYYDMVNDIKTIEIPFSDGEKGLRDVNKLSGYEDKYFESVDILEEKRYSAFKNMKCIIPIIYVIPEAEIFDNGLSIGLSTIFWDVTFQNDLRFGISFTVPFNVTNFTFPETIGFFASYSFIRYVDFDLYLSTYPMIYSVGDGENVVDYFGRKYNISILTTLPLKGKGSDSYSIGLYSGLGYYDKGNIGEYLTNLTLKIPFSLSLSILSTIQGFRPVNGFSLSFTPAFTLNLKNGELDNYVFYFTNIYSLSLPMFLPNSVTTFRLAIGYADPPIEEELFESGATFKLRSGSGKNVSGNRIMSFSIDSSIRIFRLDRGIYTIPIFFKGVYLTLTFDVAGAVFSNLPSYSSDTMSLGEYLSQFVELGTGIELTFEFNIFFEVPFEVKVFFYIDPTEFFNNPFGDKDTYSIGFTINIPFSLI